MYYDPEQCVNYLNDFIERSEQNGTMIEAGWESRLDVDVNDIVIQGSATTRVSRKQVNKCVFTRYFVDCLLVFCSRFVFRLFIYLFLFDTIPSWCRSLFMIYIYFGIAFSKLHTQVSAHFKSNLLIEFIQTFCRYDFVRIFRCFLY